MGCLIERNGIWQAVFSYQGKRVWRSTGTSDREKAQQIHDALAVEYRSWRRLTVSQFSTELALLIECSVSPGTLGLYKHALKNFVEVVGDLTLKSVSTYHVELFKARRLKQVSATRVNLEFRTLRAAFNGATKLKMIEANPFSSCDNVRVAIKEPRFLSKEEFEILLDAIDDPRLKSIVLFAVCTAMRLGEILNLQWKDVDLQQQEVHLRNSDKFVLKTKRERCVPLSRIALSVLGRLPRHSDYVFASDKGARLLRESVSRGFKRCAVKAGLPREIHFHSLRHTGASWLVQSNVPLPYVQQILGHSSITTTMVYTHSRVNHLRESIQRIDLQLWDTHW